MHFSTANDNTRSQYLPFTAQRQCDSLRGCGGGQLRFFRPSKYRGRGETKKAKNKPVNSKHVKHTCYEKDEKMYVPHVVRFVQ